MRNLFYVAVLTATLSAVSTLQAGDYPKPPACSGPFCNSCPMKTSHAGLFGSTGQTLPVFQAAPWYLYWPYDAHFQTPAPVYGQWYGPPQANWMGAPGNPYFPPTQAGYGYGGR